MASDGSWVGVRAAIVSGCAPPAASAGQPVARRLQRGRPRRRAAPPRWPAAAGGSWLRTSVRTAGRSAAASARRRPRPIGRAGQRLPGADRVAAAQFDQAVEQPAEALGVADEVAVVLQQQLQPRGVGAARRACTGRARAAARSAPRARAARRSCGSRLRRTPAAPGRSAAAPASSSVSKRFCAGLRLPGTRAQHRAAVAGQAFQVQHLRALRGQRLQQPASCRCRCGRTARGSRSAAAASASSARTTARKAL